MKKTKSKTTEMMIEVDIGGASYADFTAEQDQQSLMKSFVGISSPDKTSPEVKGVYTDKLVIQNITYNVYQKHFNRLTDEQLFNIAWLDPYVAAICRTRTGQVTPFAQVAERKSDKGLRMVDLDPPDRKDYENSNDYDSECERRQEEMQEIIKWVLNCGDENLDIQYRTADFEWRECTLKDYFQAQALNLLVTGRCASEIIYTSDDESGLNRRIAAWRPLPVQSIFPVISHADVGAVGSVSHNDASKADAEWYDSLRPDQRPMGWIQRTSSATAKDTFFTEHDLMMQYLQRQAIMNLCGFPRAPLEDALSLLLVNNSIVNFMKNRLTKGTAAKGVLLLKTPEGVRITPQTMATFKQQMTNYLARVDNSAALPIFSGNFDIQFIPFFDESENKEFLQMQDSVVLCLSAVYQIDPSEFGYGRLTSNVGLGQSNKNDEVVKGEERGLRALLDVLFEGVNKLIDMRFPRSKGKYKLSYTGVGEDTQETTLERTKLQQETTYTLNDCYQASEQNRYISYGGDVPLNPMWHSSVVRFMHYGKFMEEFFHIEGASKMKEFDFLIDPNLNQMYQQLKSGGLDLQTQQQKLQIQQTQQQMQLQQQQAQMQMQQAQQPQQPRGGGEKMAKSVTREWEIARRNLRKAYASCYED